VNETVLVLSPNDVNEATKPIADAAVGSGNGNSGGVVGSLVNLYVESLKKQRVMFALFLVLWGIVVLMALGTIFWHSYGKRILDARRRRRFQPEQRSGFEGSIGSSHRSNEKEGQTQPGREVHLPPFAPMVSSQPPNSFDRSLPENNYCDREAADDVDVGHSRSLHPLTGLVPKFKKSFDSFFDHNSNSSAPAAPNSESKLLAIGRKLTMRQKSPDSDAEKDVHSDCGSEEQQKPGWFRRVTQTVWRQETSSEPHEFVVSRHGLQRPNRPQLSISTERAVMVRNDNLPAIEKTSPSDDHGPTSAWSMSPQQPSRPWLGNIISARRPPAPTLPQRSRKASVPIDVGNSPDDGMSILTSTPEPPPSSFLTVPLHHNYPRRTPQAPPHMSPPPTRRSFNPAVFAPPPLGRTQITPPGLPPPRRTAAVNPFATPFDDEARARHPHLRMSVDAEANKNPFEGGVAM